MKISALGTDIKKRAKKSAANMHATIKKESGIVRRRNDVVWDCKGGV